ncbi:MAG TPA: hypothetical protein VII51_05660 [Gaiellaceae bacterium]
MNSRFDVSGIKSEIQFFMEKCFQASFGYFAGLVALLAISKTSYVSAIARALDVPTTSLVSGVVLALNLCYFVLVLSCLFAVLKRGYFILTLPYRSLDREWEEFSRVQFETTSEHAMGRYAWNIDNYYVIPILSLLFVVSVAAAAVGLHSGPTVARLVIAALTVFHLIPALIAWYLLQLSRQGESLIERIRASRPADGALPTGPPDAVS